MADVAQIEEEVTIVPSQSVIYAQDKAQIDVQISTAKAYPRNVTKATQNAIAMATLDKETAETCNYAVPRGGKQIVGPSVHLARILIQQWGNLKAGARVVDIDQTHVTSEAICYDLETNIAITVQVKRSIIGKTGRFSEDMITVTGNAANAIALRNAVFNVIPKGVVDKAYKAAKDMITGDISDANKLIAKRKAVVDKLKDTYSVTEEEILRSIGKASIDHIGPDEIVALIGFGQAIKDGDTTIDQVFRPEKKGSKKDEAYSGVFDSEKEKTAPETEKEKMGKQDRA